MSGEMVREGPGWNPPPWVAIHPTRVYFMAEGMTGDAFRALTMETMKGCMTGEREAGSLADELLNEVQRRSCAGRAGADSRWKGKRKPDAVEMRSQCGRIKPDAVEMRSQCGRNAVASKTDAITEIIESTERRDIQPQPQPLPPPPPPTAPAPAASGIGFGGENPGGGLGEVAGGVLAELTGGGECGGANLPNLLARFTSNPKEAVWELPDGVLPDAVAVYFGGDRDKTTAAFRSTLRKVGADAFRREFGKFIAEDAQGENEELANRAGAFHARLLANVKGRGT